MSVKNYANLGPIWELCVAAFCTEAPDNFMWHSALALNMLTAVRA